MLLSFPVARAHNFGAHFRNPQVRRATERHSSIAHSDSGVPASITRGQLLPTFFAPIENRSRLVTRENLAPESHIPITRLLNRLKLNPSGSDGQVPLLSA
jgi:hypothetical protein